MQVRDVYETVITEQYHRVRKATSDYKVVREFLEYLEKAWIGRGGCREEAHIPHYLVESLPDHPHRRGQDQQQQRGVQLLLDKVSTAACQLLHHPGDIPRCK